MYLSTASRTTHPIETFFFLARSSNVLYTSGGKLTDVRGILLLRDLPFGSFLLAIYTPFTYASRYTTMMHNATLKKEQFGVWVIPLRIRHFPHFKPLYFFGRSND